MQKRLRRLPLRRLVARAAMAIRRRPRTATVAEGAPNPMAIILPLLMVAAMVVLFTRMSRRDGPAARESSSGFSTIMPADPNARPTGDAAKDATIRMVATLDDVAGCDEAKLELTEAIDFLRS